MKINNDNITEIVGFIGYEKWDYWTEKLRGYVRWNNWCWNGIDYEGSGDVKNLTGWIIHFLSNNATMNFRSMKYAYSDGECLMIIGASSEMKLMSDNWTMWKN